MILSKNTKIFLAIACVMMALGVILGAFGAHLLKQFISEELMVVYETAIKYHFFNTLGLFAIAFLLSFKPNSKLLVICGFLIILGTLLFTVSLYLLVILKISWLGMITPIGGSILIIAWLLAAYAIIKK